MPISVDNDKESLDLYIREVSKIALLTKEEEILLTTKLHNAKFEVAKLIKKKKITETDRKNKIRYYKLQIDKYVSKLVRTNCRLVISIARKYNNNYIPFNDLIEEGNLGLIKAAHKFDPKRGCRFSTFATWWIKQAIIKAIKERGGMVRLPAHVAQEISLITSTINTLKEQKGREPWLEEIVEFVKMDKKKLCTLLAAPTSPISSNTLVHDSDLQLEDLIMDTSEAYQPAYRSMSLSLIQTVEKVLAGLSEKEAQIIEMRYGLSGRKPMVLDTVGEALGITRERVRQIQMRAIKKLKMIAQKYQLEKFLER